MAGKKLEPDDAKTGVQSPDKQTPSRARKSGVSFTQREDQVLRRLAWGYPIKSIARDLGISAKTVEFHKSAAMKKAGLADRINLLRLAVARGWMKREP